MSSSSQPKSLIQQQCSLKLGHSQLNAHQDSSTNILATQSGTFEGEIVGVMEMDDVKLGELEKDREGVWDEESDLFSNSGAHRQVC